MRLCTVVQFVRMPVLLLCLRPCGGFVRNPYLQLGVPRIYRLAPFGSIAVVYAPVLVGYALVELLSNFVAVECVLVSLCERVVPSGRMLGCYACRCALVLSCWRFRPFLPAFPGSALLFVPAPLVPRLIALPTDRLFLPLPSQGPWPLVPPYGSFRFPPGTPVGFAGAYGVFDFGPLPSAISSSSDMSMSSCVSISISSGIVALACDGSGCSGFWAGRFVVLALGGSLCGIAVAVD